MDKREREENYKRLLRCLLYLYVRAHLCICVIVLEFVRIFFFFLSLLIIKSQLDFSIRQFVKRKKKKKIFTIFDLFEKIGIGKGKKRRAMTMISTKSLPVIYIDN